mgnify:CR=1 FL=1
MQSSASPAALLVTYEFIVGTKSRPKSCPSVDVWICSFEDLLIYKLFAGRPQDIVDAHEIIVNNDFDRKYLLDIANEFKELGRDDILESLRKLIGA